MRTVATVTSLPVGTHLVAEGEVLVHVAEDGSVLASSNRCQHAGAWLGRPSGCVTTCGFHGWRLDISTMRYLAPHEDVLQPQYIVEIQGEIWTILDADPPAPWTERQPRRGLIPGSFRVGFSGGEVLVRAGGPELRWPAAGRERVWINVGSAGRLMWIGPSLLVEIAGNRLLIADQPIERAPSGLDLLVALGHGAEELVRTTQPAVVATDRPAQVRKALRGIPVWEISDDLVLDVTTGKRLT